MTALEQLAQANTQLVIPANALRDLIAEDRQRTWMEGVEVGKRLRDMMDTADLDAPLTIDEAANALGLHKNSILNLRNTGKLTAIYYPNINKVLFAKSEILRFKRQQDPRISTHIFD